MLTMPRATASVTCVLARPSPRPYAATHDRTTRPLMDLNAWFRAESLGFRVCFGLGIWMFIVHDSFAILLDGDELLFDQGYRV